MAQLLLINERKLNLLETRGPQIYGKATLQDVVEAATKQAQERRPTVSVFQRYHEGEIVDRVQAARGEE